MAWKSGSMTLTAPPSAGATRTSSSVSFTATYEASVSDMYEVKARVFIGSQAEVQGKSYDDSGGYNLAASKTMSWPFTVSISGSVSLPSAGTYYYKICCKYRWSYMGSWGEAQSGTEYIVRINYPTAPTLQSPSNNSTGVSITANLAWSLGRYGTSQKVFFGTDSGATNLINGAVVSSGTTSYDPGTLNYSTRYYWKIQNINSDGVANSSIYTFVTRAAPQPPAKPALVSPADDAEDQSRSVVLRWSDGAGGDPASSYDVYFGAVAQDVTDATKADGEFKGNISGTSYSPANLGLNTDYYWRIDAVNSVGTTKGDIWHFKTVDIAEGTPVEKKYRKLLVALAGNKFWYESNGEMTALAGLTGLDLTKPAEILTAYQKVFVVNGTLRKVVDFSNTKLTVSSFPTIPPRGTILQQLSGGSMVIDYIDLTNKHIYGFVTNGSFLTTETAIFTLDGVATDLTVTAVDAVVAGTPKVYDWDVYPHDDDEAGAKVNGDIPKQPSIMALYRGRVVLAGDPDSPHAVYMSEVANPFNFSYASDTSTSAAALTGGYAGEIGDIVTAIVPYQNDYLVLGCSQSTWLLRGDPVYGGSTEQISFASGFFDKRSYAWDSENNLYFLDQNGIYMIPQGFGGVRDITRETIPNFKDEFILRQDVHRICMVFDRKAHGILIGKTDMDDGTNQNYWFDLRTQGFFPEEYPADCSIYCADYYAADDPSRRHLLLGCRDGSIRKFNNDLYKDQTADSYATIESYVVIGPFQISKDFKTAILTEISFIIDKTSGSVDYEIYTDDTAEETLRRALSADEYPDSNGTLSVERSFSRPRTRGAFMVVVLTNSTIDNTWMLEKIIGRVRDGGRL